MSAAPNAELHADQREHLRSVVERATCALQEAGLEALIASSPANVRYLTGYSSWTHPMHVTNQTYAILTREGKRILIIPSTDADFLAMESFSADEVHTFGSFYYYQEQFNGASLSPEEVRLERYLPMTVDPHDALQKLRAVLTAEGLAEGKLALDQSHMLPDTWRRFEETLPEAGLRGAYLLLLELRAIKTPYEVELLRKSSRCTEQAIRDSLAAAAGGATDEEIRTAFIQSLARAGAEHIFSAVGVGTRTSFPNVQPEGARLEPGAILRYDVGCRYRGYASDLARNAVLAPAGEKVRRYYRAMLAGEEAMLERIRPGVRAQEVFEAAVAAVRRSGVPHYRRHHCGHGIGMDVYEPPVIRPEVSTALEAGMVLCVETPYYELGFGGLQVEDMVLVTAQGCELLTALSRELFELSG